MKLDILRKMIREEVRSAIKEEFKDILLEAILSSKSQPNPQSSFMNGGYGSTNVNSAPSINREQLRESYRNILGETAASFNTSQIGKPLQLTGVVDTTSPNGKLPEGEVPMNMIMGLLNTR